MTACWYQIRVSEVLGSQWSQWFAGLEVLAACDDDPQAGTLLCGCLADQAALFGILSQVRNLNLTLVEVRRIDAPDTPEPEETPAN